MAGIDEVLERLLTDAQFARHLAQDPASALAGYELTTDDLTLLSTQVSFDPGALSLVEERISKSSFFGLVTSITGGLAAGGGVWQPETQTSPGIVAPVDSEGVIGLSDSEGVIGPSDIQGALDPGDKVGADGIIIIGGTQADDVGAGGGGAGGEVSIREAAVPAPGATQGFVIDGGVGNPEGVVAPVDSEGVIGPTDTGDAQGIIVQGGLSEGIIVQGGLSEADGVVVQGGMTPPDGVVVQGGLTEGIIIQGGLSDADGVVVQGGLTEGIIVQGGLSDADGVVVQGGLTESEAVTYPI